MAASLVSKVDERTLFSVASQFAVAGVPARVESHTGGHINDTWFVATHGGGLAGSLTPNSSVPALRLRIGSAAAGGSDQEEDSDQDEEL